MNSHEALLPFSEPLTALLQLLSHFGNRGVIIGGIAVLVLGEPRATADIDALLLLSTEDLPELIAVAARYGLTPRISVAVEFARRHRVLLLQHDESGIPVDISLAALPFEEEVIERGTFCDVGDVHLRLPTPEDLIILKAVAHRPKDLIDIQTIVDAQPTLDRARIRHWVQEFAKFLEMPELWDDIAHLFRL